jgi:hypothetical protein
MLSNEVSLKFLRIFMDNNARRPPNCLKCVHFKITWETAFPRACLLFGIKGQNLPSGEVFRATGRQCPSFELKPGLE